MANNHDFLQCGKDSKGHGIINKARAMRGHSKPRIVPHHVSRSPVLSCGGSFMRHSAVAHRLVNVFLTGREGDEGDWCDWPSAPFQLMSRWALDQLSKVDNLHECCKRNSEV